MYEYLCELEQDGVSRVAVIKLLFRENLTEFAACGLYWVSASLLGGGRLAVACMGELF